MGTAHALIECNCGKELNVDIYHTTCPKCGADHTQVLREMTGRDLSDDVLHPSHREYEAWFKFKQRHPDYDEEWPEIRDLE